MATTTTVANAQAKIAFAQNVKLKVGSDDFTLMRNVDFGWTRPETRYAHGLTRTYGHGPPDAELTFSISGNAGAYAYIMNKSDGTAISTHGGDFGKPERGVLKNFEWTVELVGNDGQKEELTMQGKLRDITVRKPDGDNSEVVDMDCFVRITDDVITVKNTGG